MKKAINIRVYGVVQGVFFRQCTQGTAFKLGLKGWVKNCEDGSVEMEAEGDEKELDKFVEWCRIGPDNAFVTKIELKEIEPRDFTSFEVRR